MSIPYHKHWHTHTHTHTETQQTKLASLDKIIQANARRKKQFLDSPLTTPTTPSPLYDPVTLNSPDVPTSGVNGMGTGLGNGKPREVPSFGFDEDEDSDMEGQSR